MRYIYSEPVITVVTDEELTDEMTIKELIQSLKDADHRVHLAFEDPETSFVRTLDNVRILAINEKSIDIHAFLATASVKYKDIPILNIRKIRLVASRSILSKKYKVSRFHHMEVAELDEL